MRKVSKNNYLHLLRETIDVLSQIQDFLQKNQDDNGLHIDNAIQCLQNVVRHQGRRNLGKAGDIYRKKVEEEIRKRKQKFLEHYQQNLEQNNNEEEIGQV